MKIYVLISAFFTIFFSTSPGFVQAKRPPTPRYNVILIDITSLRTDHLSCYGYPRKTSPFIDQLAKDGVWFKQAVSQAYWTLPSVTSILTSRYVSSHQVFTRNQKLDDSQITLAEVLKKYGYRTAAFVGGLDLDKAHNLSQGFEVYSSDTQDKPMGSFAEAFPLAVNWLKENKDRDLFLFIQGYDVHPPFCSPSGYQNIFDPGYKGIIDRFKLDYGFLKRITNKGLNLEGDKDVKLSKNDINHIIAHYDGGIAYADKLLAGFMEDLDKLNLTDKTIIFILSDHGEELLDHGSFDRFASASPFEEVIRVLWIIKHPRIKGLSFDRQVELVDVAPTVLGLLNIPPGEQMQGKDLSRIIKQKADFSSDNCVYSGWGKKVAAREGEWKIIFNGQDFELYNIKKDPGELNNVFKQNPDVSAGLIKKLFNWHIVHSAAGGLTEMEISPGKMPDLFKSTQQRSRRYILEAD